MKINERTHFTKFMKGDVQPKDPGATWRKDREDEEIETFFSVAPQRADVEVSFIATTIHLAKEGVVCLLPDRI